MTLLQAAITSALPAILKFGVTGLSAIVFILAYRLMRQVIARTNPPATKALISLTRSFMWISLTFCGLSAVAAAFQQVWDSKARETTASLELLQTHMAQRAREAIEARYTGQRGKDALVHAVVLPISGPPVPTTTPGNTPQITVVPNEPGDHATPSGQRPIPLDSPLPITDLQPGNQIPAASNSAVVGETEELTPQSTGLTREELNYRKLRRAVFESFYDFNADKGVLSAALDLLLNDYPELSTANARVLDDFTALRSLRLRWLRDDAIPQLQEAQEAQGDAQTSPIAAVGLPQEVRVAEGVDGTSVVTDLELLHRELAILRD